MASIGGLTLKIESMLYGQARVERPMEDTVTTAPSPALSGGTITPGTVGIWKRNDYAEVIGAAGVESEVFIFGADGGVLAAIRRAQRGTTAATITTGSIIRKNPLFDRHMIVEFIGETIRSHLHPHVWYRSERTLTWDDNHTYSLSADDDSVVQMYQHSLSGGDEIHPFAGGSWRVIPSISTTVEASGKALELAQPVDGIEPVYYTARTIPKVANIATFPDSLADLIPWKVAGLLLGGTRTAPARYDPNRQANPEWNDGGTVRDWRFFEAQFLAKRDEERRRLRFEERHLRQADFVPRRRRRIF